MAMYVQNNNSVIKFTLGINPALIMQEYLIENENIKNSQNPNLYLPVIF